MYLAVIAGRPVLQPSAQYFDRRNSCHLVSIAGMSLFDLCFLASSWAKGIPNAPQCSIAFSVTSRYSLRGSGFACFTFQRILPRHRMS